MKKYLNISSLFLGRLSIVVTKIKMKNAFIFTYSQIQGAHIDHHGILQVGIGQASHTGGPGGTEITETGKKDVHVDFYIFKCLQRTE